MIEYSGSRAQAAAFFQKKAMEPHVSSFTALFYMKFLPSFLQKASF